MNVGKVLRETAQRIPQKTALIFRDEKLTFSHLDLITTRLANKLKSFTVSKGDPVAIILPNSSQWIVAYFGVMKLGAIAVPLDFRLKEEELLAILKDARVKAIITSSHHLQDGIFSKLDGIEGIIVSGKNFPKRAVQYEEVIRDKSLSSETEVEVKEEDIALYLYTSGTTGKPKGVVLAFSNLDLFPEALTTFCHTSEDDVVGCPLPLSHISGPIVSNEMVVRGSTFCVIDQLRPDKILTAMEKYRITYFFGVPPIFEALLHAPHRDRYDLSSLRFVSMMGTSVPLNLLEKFQKAFPSITVIQGYGLTETSPLVTLLPPKYAQRKMGSIGLAAPRAEIKLVNDRGKEVSEGEVGELTVKGPMVMKGYHNNPEATSEKIKDGWFYTGDLCKKDKDGFYYYVGRKDDLIIVGGLNVYPAEIEQVLQEHPLLKEVGVVGIPSEDRGEVIKAVVVPATGSEVTKKEIVSYCRERLADYKVPKVVEVWDELPKSSSGKVARRLLVNSQ